MNKGNIVERLCSDLIAKSRDINRLLYFTVFLADILLPDLSEVELLTSASVGDSGRPHREYSCVYKVGC